MSDGYTKLYGHKLLNSTLWGECWQARLVFVSMLALADRRGFVCTPGIRVLARAVNLTEADTSAGLAVLEAPDEDSRSEAEEGRRVIRVQGGWVVVNYEKYREYRTQRQEADRQRAADKRSRRIRSAADESADRRDSVDSSQSRRQIAPPADGSDLCSEFSSLSEIQTRARADDVPAAPSAPDAMGMQLAVAAAADAMVPPWSPPPFLSHSQNYQAAQRAVAAARARGIPQSEAASIMAAAALREAREAGKPGLVGHLLLTGDAWAPQRPKAVPARNVRREQARATTGADFEDAEDIETQMRKQGFGNG